MCTLYATIHKIEVLNVNDTSRYIRPEHKKTCPDSKSQSMVVSCYTGRQCNQLKSQYRQVT